MKPFVLGLGIILLFIIFLGGCASIPPASLIPPTPSTNSPITPFHSTVQKGTGFWPMHTDTTYVDKWFSFTREAGNEVFSIQKGNPFDEPAQDDAANYNTALNLALERAKQEGYKTYLGLEPFIGDRKALDTLPGDAAIPRITDELWRSLYLEIIRMNISRHEPHYFNPCVEVNMWKENVSAEEWQSFRMFYSQIYSEVKKLSPETKVFCSLQYELMAGKLYGNTQTTQWDLLDNSEIALPLQDLLGISSYPYGNVSDIQNWYEGLRSRKENIPSIFVAETGYISNDAAQQSLFVKSLPALWKELPLHTLLWLDLVEMDSTIVPNLPEFLYTQGLIQTGFIPKPSFEVWKKL